jgi:hypothetical protein
VILPSIELRPKIDVGDAIRLLEERATNIRNEAQPAGITNLGEKRNAYVKATTTTETRLRSILSIRDAAKLFDGPRHRDICSMAAGEQLHPMIGAEVDALSHRLETLALELDNARKPFQDKAKCIVLDSTFYVEHPEKLEDAGFHQLVQWPGVIKILVPMVVIDELDGLKRSGERFKRWRAGYSLAVFDDRIDTPPWPGLLHEEVMEPNLRRGRVWLEIIFDFPGHDRLPINDDEIVDRAVACEPYSGPVTVVTYDTGQSQRARIARLGAMKLRNDPEPPPDAA